ncbi:aldo/keto reductase [Gehongia tenuis]|uniref:Aldo/keto reductase n=1 Tax=Gehongia tenuis TaxID=2763655 RepID=A0A926HP52_9FIRM|nr:aldo/keto reductase [Gehongia tenuis]MBC8531304.1 aldo/keto reductase [Gehongia tenuis]
MIYKPFQELKLSALGFGSMRLPTAGKGGPIDEVKARELVEYAYEQGINYFDTAYRYHEGESEKFMGRVLSELPRDSWYLASKMPGHMMYYRNGRVGFSGYLSSMAVKTPREIFLEQLEKCRVDYFDFYLLHNLCETSYDFYTDEDLAVVDYLLQQKKAGWIRHLGFSAHGRAETIERFLNWRDDFEFAQIQLNYMDWSLQDAKRKYEILTEHGIPVMVMEPCRGGRLAELPPQAGAMLKKARPEDTIASWAFRFLQSLSNVQVVLSGMTTMEQLKENLTLFSREDPTTPEERALLEKVVGMMADLVPCTGCRYCMEECPQGLDIPKLISMYNELKHDGMGTVRFTLDAMTPGELPGACLGCGACRRICPQGIDIPGILKDFAQRIQNHSVNG